MSATNWLDLLWLDSRLYLWAAYLVGTVLLLIEMTLLAIREREILGHLNWKGTETKPVEDPGPNAGLEQERHRQ